MLAVSATRCNVADADTSTELVATRGDYNSRQYVKQETRTSRFSGTSNSQSTTRSLVSAAGLLTVGNLISRLLGLVREQVIAALFGASADTSVFATALTVPTMVYDLLIGGAVSAALVPVFSNLAASEDDSDRLSRATTTTALVAGLVLVTTTALLILGAEPLARMLGAADGSQFDRTVRFIRLVLPAVVPLGLSAVFTG